MRYEFTEHPDREGWYMVTDTRWMMTCSFKEHRFNETQEFDTGMMPVHPGKAAQVMRELGEWLMSHHYSEAMDVPVYELRMSEDDSELSIIRHKAPEFRLTMEPTSLDGIEKALEKAIEYVRKRALR